MSNSYSVNILNGSGQKNILDGYYDTDAYVVGYVDSSLTPGRQTVTSDVDIYNFQIEAEGTLTIHVTESGLPIGVPVSGAKFIRCNKGGTQDYGTEITTEVGGLANFNNVPFGLGAPKIYYRQTASDVNHSFSTSVLEITMTLILQTVEIVNPRK